MKKILILLFITTSSWTADAQHCGHGSAGVHDAHSAHQSAGKQTTTAFKDKNLTIAYGDYLALKNSLVNSDFMGAKNAASELFMSLESVKKGQKVYAEASKVAKATTLDDQRQAFAELCKEMAALVKSQLTEGEIFLNYCPMAFDNKGAHWLSESATIRNPYFGEAMLACGKVKDFYRMGQKAPERNQIWQQGGGGHNH